MLELANVELFVGAETLKTHIEKLAEKIDEDLCEVSNEIVVMPVLSGGMLFASDLIRRFYFTRGVKIAPAIVSRYENELRSDRTPQIKYFPSEEEIRGKTVLIVDDIYDKGDTIEVLKDACIDYGANSVRVVVLICRETISNPQHEHSPDYYAYLVDDDRFFFGYGMDVNGKYRGLEDIWSFPIPSVD